MSQLVQRGINTANVVELNATQSCTIQDSPALLFERIPGKVEQKPPYALDKIGGALASIHLTQMEQSLTLDESFSFDESCMIWLPTFEKYLHESWNDREVEGALKRLASVAEWHHSGENRGVLFGRSVALHCHGDVTPKNVIMVDDDAWFFDFNNAFHGPRMADIIDGAFEFSLAEKYFYMADFSRFNEWIECYSASAPLSTEEQQDIQRWVELVGLIKFTKELRVVTKHPGNVKLRRDRALAIADFVLGSAS